MHTAHTYAHAFDTEAAAGSFRSSDPSDIVNLTAVSLSDLELNCSSAYETG